MTYLDELLVWNRTTNLTSISNEQEVIVKHFIDSIAGLAAEPFIRQARVLDVGSGAGFPGIPLKILRPDCPMTLLEPSGKKASFLHFIVGALKLPDTRIVTATIERFATEDKDLNFNYVVTRALKYGVILTHARRLLADAGKVILYLASPIEQPELAGHWAIDREFEFVLPLLGGKRVLTVLRPAA